jgi:beta-N-acetylhexosaminidase
VLVAGLVAALLATGAAPRRAPPPPIGAWTAPAALTRHAKAGSANRPPKPPVARTTAVSGQPSPARMLGQMIVARFAGPTPPASLLDRVRRGEVGGVILFADNVAGGTLATRRLTQGLQRAAAQGGNPPLLIMTDQEGGTVKRLSGPPDLAAADMTSQTSAQSEGAATGRLLRLAGVNVDLAPVADVEQAPGSFLGTRAFASSPLEVAGRACGFAHGLESQGVAYTLKHFPGLGLATGDTDTSVVSVDAPAGELRADYAAYARCGAGRLAMVMVSSAIYPSLSGPLPAVMSPEIYQRELPIALGGSRALTISDDLQSVAIAAQTAPARRAIEAGLDLLMYAQTDQASASAYAELLDEVNSGSIPIADLRAADEKIVHLKRLLGR